jgi:protein-tyrosine-phosphatase
MTHNTAGRRIHNGTCSILNKYRVPVDTTREVIHYDEVKRKASVVIDLSEIISDPYHTGDFERTYAEICDLIHEIGLVDNHCIKYRN